MAFPVVASLTPTAFSTAATHLVAMPATVNAGDLLVVKFVNREAGGPITVTTPGGWTALGTGISSTSVRLSNYYKIAAGTEGGTTVDFVTSATEKAAAHVYRITGWHGTTPPEDAITSAGNDANPDPPNLAPSWGAADTLWLVGVGITGIEAGTVYPTNYTDGATQATTGGMSVTVASARRALNAASENPGTFTIASARWVAGTLAIRPSAGVTGTIAVTQAADVGALSGTVANPITGTIAVSQAAQTMAATGTETFTGTIAATQADQTGAFTGTVANPITGTIAANQADQTGAFTGTTVTDGTWNSTQADQVGAFTGIVANPITGVLGAIQGDDVGSFTGTVQGVITGTIAATQADQVADFDGTVISPALPPPGTVTCTIGGPTVGCVLTAPSVACTITQVSVAGTDTIITSTFKNAAGTLTDPAAVTATVQHPDGSQTSPTPSSSSVGIWTTVIPSDLDEGGWWFGQIQGTGNGVNAVCKFSFCLEASLVLV